MTTKQQSTTKQLLHRKGDNEQNEKTKYTRKYIRDAYNSTPKEITI